jgi:hypothetical protein
MRPASVARTPQGSGLIVGLKPLIKIERRRVEQEPDRDCGQPARGSACLLRDRYTDRMRDPRAVALVLGGDHKVAESAHALLPIDLDPLADCNPAQ